ncbi:MFS transporter [Geomicrobium sp. JCM 19055]|uniref:CynX/NimT family MFS transporter n=1 Tax=Geomicrobium sp. JCM 19055 TaxID=1460649 RepID=UPI00045ED3B5|nr:MFS transporter [Geomicrobium sp. JCM 19055]GAJ97723.1 ABC transporter permease [Geomicrobium sp. JCM 19055]
MQLSPEEKSNRYYTFLLILAILIIASTLRSPMTSVGPLVPFIREDLQISNSTVGLLNTLPLIAFGLFSPFVPRLSRKYGMEVTLMLAMVILSFGIFIRSTGSVSFLLTGTVLLGIGIAVGNVLMPGLIKMSFPYRIGLMTGIYSVSMNVFGALASGISVPVASSSMFSWQSALQLWGILSVVAIIVLLMRLPAILSEDKKVPGKVNNQPSSALFKSKIAWAVTLYMGFQSFIPYSIFTWLPDMMLEKGFDATEAGWFMAIYQAGLIPATFIVPMIAAKMHNQRMLALLSGVLLFTGLLGTSLSSSYFILVFLILTGMGAGTTFSLAMMFFVLRTRTVTESAQLSGMAQSVGYLIAATGPILLGTVAQWTNGWTVPFMILMGVATCIALFGLVAGQNKLVIADPKG